MHKIAQLLLTLFHLNSLQISQQIKAESTISLTFVSAEPQLHPSPCLSIVDLMIDDNNPIIF